MAQCAQCLYENEDEASSCEQCGADVNVEVLSLQLGQVCRHCDSYNDPGVDVCVSCGQPLGATMPPAENTMPPTEKETFPSPSTAGASQPWMAAPNTGEFSKKLAAGRAAAERLLEQSPVVVAMPVPVPVVAAAALPPSALPPGWAGSVAKPSIAVARGPQEAMIACPKCRAENPPSARYCGKCGQGLLPSPSVARARGKLILIRGSSAEGKQFSLLDAASAAGRSEGVLTFPEDPYIGGLHATFLFRGDELLVRDEGAANGVYVRLREAQPLRPGDMFNVGERLLRYSGTVTATPTPVARHGSPRSADRLQVLEEILEGGSVGRVCKRAGPLVTIGRAGCDLNFPTDGFVSARHAELSIAGETAFLRDLGSANGTFVRVQPRSERALAHGDYLLLGRELLRVELAASR